MDNETTQATPGDAKPETGGGLAELQKERNAPTGDAKFELDDKVLTVSEALAYLHLEGYEIKERTLQRYCREQIHGLVCSKVSTISGQEWHISQRSLDRYMRDNPDKKRQINSIELLSTEATPGVASDDNKNEEPVVQPSVETNATATPGVAFDAVDQIKFLRGQIQVKDKQIETLLERDRETNVLIQGLQTMVLQLRAPDKGEVDNKPNDIADGV